MERFLTVVGRALLVIFGIAIISLGMTLNNFYWAHLAAPPPGYTLSVFSAAMGMVAATAGYIYFRSERLPYVVVTTFDLIAVVMYLVAAAAVLSIDCSKDGFASTCGNTTADAALSLTCCGITLVLIYLTNRHWAFATRMDRSESSA